MDLHIVLRTLCECCPVACNHNPPFGPTSYGSPVLGTRFLGPPSCRACSGFERFLSGMPRLRLFLLFFRARSDLQWCCWPHNHTMKLGWAIGPGGPEFPSRFPARLVGRRLTGHKPGMPTKTFIENVTGPKISVRKKSGKTFFSISEQAHKNGGQNWGHTKRGALKMVARMAACPSRCRLQNTAASITCVMNGHELHNGRPMCEVEFMWHCPSTWFSL